METLNQIKNSQFVQFVVFHVATVVALVVSAFVIVFRAYKEISAIYQEDNTINNLVKIVNVIRNKSEEVVA